jgi:hypothetical protein
MTLQMTASLGDVVAAAFDRAGYYVSEPRARARLATRAVRQMLRQGERIDHEFLAAARARVQRSRAHPAPEPAGLAT